MSENDAIEAALNQYSLLLTGIPAGDHSDNDQDGMREELNALLQLMRPHMYEPTQKAVSAAYDAMYLFEHGNYDLTLDVGFSRDQLEDGIEAALDELRGNDD